MENGSKCFACALALLLMCLHVAAQSSVIRVLNEQEQPVEGAIIILKPVTEKSSSAQRVYFTSSAGEATVKLSARSTLLIHCFGYSEFKDTVDINSDLTFHLTKVEVNLNEVVVTGQYDINTSDQSVYSVKVVDAKTIQQMGAQNLTDVLENQLSVRLTQDNILGSSADINGISGQNIKILVDGVPVIGRENGNIDLSQINMNNAERIEIIEGPMSVSYGTDALGGVINIVTKKSGSYPVEGNVHLYYESQGTYNGDAGLFFKRGEHAVSLSGGRYFFDGYPTEDTLRYQEWKPKLQYFGTGQYNYASQFLNIGLKSEYFNEEIQNKGTPVLTPYQAYAFDDYYFTRRLNQSLFIEYRLKNNAHVQFTNAYNNYRRIKNTFRKDLVTLQQELSSGEGSQDTAVFDEWTLRGTYSTVLPARKINFQAGYDVNLQSGKGESLEAGVQRIDDYAVFGSMEYEAFNNFYLRPALRFAYNSRYGAPLTPSLNVKYDFLNKYTLRASYAHGFRSPSLKELDLDFVDVNHNIHGNDSLSAESSENFGASFIARHSIADVKLKGEVSFFYNDINDIITLALIDASTQYYTYINIDQFKTRGANFTAEINMKNFSFNTGFSLLGLYNSVSDTADVESFSLTPEFQNNFVLTFPKADMEAAVFFKSTGSTPGFNLDEDGNVYQTFIEPYTIMNTSLTKYFLDHNVSLTAGVKNVFDVTDLQSNVVGSSFHSSTGDLLPYATGRFFFAGLSFRIRK